MIDVEDWAEIRRLHRAEGMSIKVIGRRVGVARYTVREALRSTEPPRYQRPGTVEVARHARCLATHQTITSPEHSQLARQLRAEHTVIGAFAAAFVEQRDLNVYDRAIGAS